MGNKRVPQELKILRGTYRADRDPRDGEALSDVLHDVPRAPQGLGKHGRGLWHRLSAYLVDAGILLDHHLPILQILCMEFSVYMNSSIKLADDDPLPMDERRELRLLKNGAYQGFRLMLLEFGLTPSAAEKIPKPKPRREMDAIEKIITGGGK